MSTHIQFSSPGRSFGSGKGLLHGIKLGTQTVTPRNWKSVMSFSHGLSSPVNAASSRASGTGHQSSNSFVITKQKDSSTPLLYQACCSNEVLRSIVLSLIQNDVKGTGGKEVVVSRVTLTNASIVKYTRSVAGYIPPKHGPRSSTDTQELEEFSFTFQAIDITNLMGTTSASEDWMA